MAPTLRAAAERSRDIVSKLVNGTKKQVTSLTIEQGSINLLSTSGLQVLDFRTIPADPKHFREGLVSDAPRVAARIKEALQDMTGAHRRVMGVVPGYQTTLRRLELPDAKGMDPKVIIPREARRKLGISPETSSLTWHQMASSSDSTNWLVLSATNRSIASLSASVQSAGLRIVGMELKPFALARALNQPDAICAWAAEDGCDAVVIRDWTPVTHQSAYWGAGSMVETTDVVNRITELLESTILAHDMQNPELSVSEDIPLYVTGSSVGRDRGIAQRVAANLRRQAASPDPPIPLPAGFPIDHLLINVGLAQRGCLTPGTATVISLRGVQTSDLSSACLQSDVSLPQTAARAQRWITPSDAVTVAAASGRRALSSPPDDIEKVSHSVPLCTIS